MTQVLSEESLFCVRSKLLHRPNENKMSDGGRGRASLGVEVWRSSQKWSVQRSVVRSIDWLGPVDSADCMGIIVIACPKRGVQHSKSDDEQYQGCHDTSRSTVL